MSRPAVPDKIEYSKVSIGVLLRATREALGLTQTRFAEDANVGLTAYNQYESGKKQPSLATALWLCDTHDLTLDWIYRGDPSGLRYGLAEKLKISLKMR